MFRNQTLKTKMDRPEKDLYKISVWTSGTIHYTRLQDYSPVTLLTNITRILPTLQLFEK